MRLPPLRDRAEDIPLLVDGLLVEDQPRAAQARARYVTPDDHGARSPRYPWPGNVRELENTLTRAVVLAKGEVLEARHLPIGADRRRRTRPRRRGRCPRARCRRCARSSAATSQRVLVHAEWNKRRACAVLEISRPTLDRKIEEYGLTQRAAR